MKGSFRIYFQPADTEEEIIEIQNQCEGLKADIQRLIDHLLGGGSVASSDFERGVYFEYDCQNDDPNYLMNKIEMAVAKYNWLDRMPDHSVW